MWEEIQAQSKHHENIGARKLMRQKSEPSLRAVDLAASSQVVPVSIKQQPMEAAKRTSLLLNANTLKKRERSCLSFHLPKGAPPPLEGLVNTPPAVRNAPSSPGSPSLPTAPSGADVKRLSAIKAHVTTKEANGKPTLQSGTITGIIDWLLAKLGSYDPHLLHCFLLCYRLYCSPKELWELLLAHYDIKNANKSMEERRRIIDFILIWISKCGNIDFFSTEGKLVAHPLWKSLHQFMHELRVAKHEAFVQLVVTKVQALVQQGQRSDETQGNISGELGIMWNLYQTLFPRTLVPGQFDFIDLHPQEVAVCLTADVWHNFVGIPATEFIHRTWVKQPEKSKVARMVDEFNKVSFWVASEILSKEDLSQRVSVLEAFISTAEKLFSINNFHSAMEILCGLNMAAVQRLKITWRELSASFEDMFERMNASCSPESNYRAYRNQIRDIKNAGQPCIPWIGLYLKDCTFIAENMSYMDEDKTIINLEKVKLLGSLCLEVTDLQARQYQLAEIDPNIVSYFESIVVYSEKDLYKRSLHIEPRVAEAHF